MPHKHLHHFLLTNPSSYMEIHPHIRNRVRVNLYVRDPETNTAVLWKSVSSPNISCALDILDCVLSLG